MRRSYLLLVAGLLPVACGESLFDPVDPDPDPPDGDGSFQVAFDTVATGLTAPVLAVSPPGDDRLFIVQQDGLVLIHQDGALLPDPFLDLRGRVNFSGESGLLGLAFHPDYAQNGYFYVNYTDGTFVTHIVRYRASADPARADASSAAELLTLQQPYSNHNGGHLEFDPSGMLMIALGDGGSGGDPRGNAQNPGVLLGKILRIDVDAGTPYGIPADNPFVGVEGARPEIWALGLRNPWRFAIDAEGGRIWIGDVGQNRIEEIDVAPVDSGGINYGWAIMEGSECYEADTCDREGLMLPVAEYTHTDGCSITGGRVYRGSAIPGLVGHYVYSDYCSGWIRSFLLAESGPTLEREWDVASPGFVTSFGVDAAGELYVTVAGSGGTGQVLRVVPAD